MCPTSPVPRSLVCGPRCRTGWIGRLVEEVGDGVVQLDIGEVGPADQLLLRVDRQRIPGTQIVQVLLRDRIASTGEVQILLADQDRSAVRGADRIFDSIEVFESMHFVVYCHRGVQFDS
jgi:hypothetical protein